MAKEKTEMTVVDMSALPVVGLGADLGELEAMTKANEYLKRIQLYSKGKAIDTGLIAPGNYGTPGSDTVVCLGPEIDVIPLCVRNKAIDSSDRDAIVISYNKSAPEFVRIENSAEVKDSNCQWGFAFLVFERSSKDYYEFFFGSKTARNEVANVSAFLPKTPEQIAEQTKKLGRAPQASGPCTLKVKYIENKAKGWGWHAPVTFPCSTPFKGFDPAVAAETIEKFMAQKDSTVEKVPEDTNARAH